MANAPLSSQYIVHLVVQPVIGLVLTGWFLREVTVANMTSAFKDRSSGLVLWFTVTTPLLAAALAAQLGFSRTYSPDQSTWGAMTAMLCFLGFAAVLFQGISIRSRKPGPTVIRTMLRLLGLGLLCLAAITIAATTIVTHRAYHFDIHPYIRYYACTGWAYAAFFVFVVGLAAWLCTRAATVGGARIWLFALLLCAISGPFIFAAMTGVLSDSADSTMIFAAPSPAYTLTLPRYYAQSAHHDAYSAVEVSGAFWFVLGLWFLGFAVRGARASGASGERHGEREAARRPCRA